MKVIFFAFFAIGYGHNSRKKVTNLLYYTILGIIEKKLVLFPVRIYNVFVALYKKIRWI